MYFRATATLLTVALFSTTGCEGGKAENKTCDPNAPAPYNQCQSNAQCPVGYTEIGDSCKLNSLDCPPGEHEDDGVCVVDQLEISVVSQTACWIKETGAVQFIVQYTARDETGRNLAAASDVGNELQARFFVDQEPMDSEAQISSDSELLKSNLLLSLVLDASYSMLEHEPPAFGPMKNAAMDILQEAQNVWSQTGSQFDWQLLWFDTALYTPLENMAGEPWSISDIAQIPTPKKGTYTALYKAINKMVNLHEELYTSGVAAGPRDQHVMLVLSDGGDNQYHVDNSGLNEEQSLGNNMLFWTKTGGPATKLEEVKQNVASAPNLRTFVIGFGAFFNDAHKQALKDIASSGRGEYFYGANTENLEQLFQDVQAEFVTLQTLGARVPMNETTHTMSLLVKHPLSGAQGQKDFTIEAGPALGACADSEQ